MMIDRRWVERNLGFDPIATPAPASTFAFARGRNVPPASKICRERSSISIPRHRREESSLRSRPRPGSHDIPMCRGPKDLRRKPTRRPPRALAASLPAADVLVVTWTVDEGHALSRVLTPGKDSRNDYRPYTHNFASISRKMRAGCPALQAKRLGAYWTTKIGAKSVVVFKSDSHMSQDGPQLPNIDVWTSNHLRGAAETRHYHRHRGRDRQAV